MKNQIIEFWKTGENPITCFRSRKTTGSFGRIPADIVSKSQGRGFKTNVTVVDQNGIKKTYNSVVLASKAINITCGILYAVLNGRCKNTSGLQIYKT